MKSDSLYSLTPHIAQITRGISFSFREIQFDVARKVIYKIAPIFYIFNDYFSDIQKQDYLFTVCAHAALFILWRDAEVQKYSLENNEPRYLLIEFSQVEQEQTMPDEDVLSISRRILAKNKEAYEVLAK